MSNLLTVNERPDSRQSVDSGRSGISTDIPPELKPVHGTHPDFPPNGLTMSGSVNVPMHSVVDEYSEFSGVAPQQETEPVGIYGNVQVQPVETSSVQSSEVMGSNASANVAGITVVAPTIATASNGQNTVTTTTTVQGNPQGYDFTFNKPDLSEFSNPIDISELKIAPDTMAPTSAKAFEVVPVQIVETKEVVADPSIQALARSHSLNVDQADLVDDDRVGNILVAGMPFVARQDDEMTIQKGDLVQVEKLYKDGFASGTNLNTSDRQTGLFPIGILQRQGATPVEVKQWTKPENYLVGAEMMGLDLLPFIQDLPRDSSYQGGEGAVDERSGKIYACKLPFAARTDDETSLRPGDAVRIDQVYKDGFAKGENETLLRPGFFPVGCLDKEELVKAVMETKQPEEPKWELPEDYGEYGKTVVLANGVSFTPRPAPEYKSEEALANAKNLGFEPIHAYASPAQNYPVVESRGMMTPLIVVGDQVMEGERPGPYVKPDVDKLTNRLIAPNVYENPYGNPNAHLMVPGTPYTPGLDVSSPVAPRPRILPNPLAIAAAGSVVLQRGASQQFPSRGVTPAGSRSLTPIGGPPRSTSLSGEADQTITLKGPTNRTIVQDSRVGQTFTVKMPFQAVSVEELNVVPGDVVKIEEVYSDGFMKVTDKARGTTGVITCSVLDEFIKSPTN